VSWDFGVIAAVMPGGRGAEGWAGAAPRSYSAIAARKSAAVIPFNSFGMLSCVTSGWCKLVIDLAGCGFNSRESNSHAGLCVGKLALLFVPECYGSLLRAEFGLFGKRPKILHFL